MSSITSIDNRQSIIVKFLLLVTSCLILATTLTGCKAVGSSKPAALQITTTPEASVFLDGKHLGKTPFSSDQLEAREYLVKITTGEASFVDKVALSPGTLTVINRELNNNFLAQAGENLKLIRGQDGLLIISFPDRAKVQLDGKSYGETPVKIDDIKEGEHKLVLTKIGYLDREISIKTSKKYQLLADVTLASEIAKGAEVASSPQPHIQKVEILNTPQGFLRVRYEPSATSIEIGRVKTGDQREIVQETEGWIQIKFEGPSGNQTDKQGWVSTQFARKLPQ